ncbi:MAG TPA: hypothetical protein VIL85_03980 [Thermomicrobiales bacterium]
MPVREGARRAWRGEPLAERDRDAEEDGEGDVGEQEAERAFAEEAKGLFIGAEVREEPTRFVDNTGDVAEEEAEREEWQGAPGA